MMEAAAPDERRRRRRVERALLAATIAVAAASALPLAASVLLRRPPPAGGASARPLVTPAGLVQRSGVRVTRVVLSGDGGLLDLRYQVVDAEKAQAVHEAPPLLIDERSGAVVSQLLMGHIHSQKPKLGLSYYLIFENPGDIVRAGDRVIVQLGNARLPDVAVQ